MDALTLAHHLQTNGNAPPRLGLEPGKAPVTVHAAHELARGRRAGQSAPQGARPRYGPLRRVSGERHRPNDGRARTRWSEGPHGTKVVSNDALRGFHEHVSGPDGISARDPGTMLATQRHAREREGVARKA